LIKKSSIFTQHRFFLRNTTQVFGLAKFTGHVTV
jgi:hypothetical protein